MSGLNRISVFIVVAVLLSALQPRSYAASDETADMLNPAFWTESIPGPDDAISGPGDIERLNSQIRAMDSQMSQVEAMPDVVEGGVLSDWLIHDPLPCCDANLWGKRFGSDRGELKEDFFSSLLFNMNIGGVSDVNQLTFGVITGNTAIRAFPTDEAILKSPQYNEFDSAQYSMAYPGDSIALLHKSMDNEWGFFQTRDLRGWIRLDKVAFGTRPDIFRKQGDFIVVTGSWIVLYRDSLLREVVARVPMGTVLYLAKDFSNEAGSMAVRYPRGSNARLIWSKAYIDKSSDISMGHLPYTKRTIITQAFKMLGEDYGWGGSGLRRDCSAFIKDIFATAGIILPRNSKKQAMVGVVSRSGNGFIPDKDISGILEGSAPGMTLIAMDGHIMLFLGMRRGSPFVIHQIFGYGDARGFVRLGRVSVTGLDLGEGSKTGAFFKRIRAINTIELNDHATAKNPDQPLN